MGKFVLFFFKKEFATLKRVKEDEKKTNVKTLLLQIGINQKLAKLENFYFLLCSCSVFFGRNFFEIIFPAIMTKKTAILTHFQD